MALKRVLLTMTLLALVLAGGCMTMDQTKFSDQVRQWVPVGTSQKDAERIMGKHGFDCTLIPSDSMFNSTGGAYLECIRDYVYQHTWTARLLITDHKVTGYGEISVDNETPTSDFNTPP